MDLKQQVENLVGEGALFRVTGRKGNPVSDEEYKLVFHGQVLEDYDAIGCSNLPRLEALRQKRADKEIQREAAESSRKQAAQALKEMGNHVGNDQVENRAQTRQELQRFRLDDLQKKETELRKEEKELIRLVDNLQKKCSPQTLKTYYATNGSMLHIVAAKAKLAKFKIRINYIGQTTETDHCRCERVSSILHGIRSQHAHQLPQNSDDFKIRDALYWRCAATRMLRLDEDKCLCEYGINEGSTFEHDIEKVPMSKLARTQMSEIKGKSKIKSMIGEIRAQRSSSSQRRNMPSSKRSGSSNSLLTSANSTITSSTADTEIENQVSASRVSSPACSVASSASTVDAPGEVKEDLPVQSESLEHLAASDAEIASLRQRERNAVKDMKRAQKLAQKADKMLREAERKRRAAEAAASRAQSSAHLQEYASLAGASEIETARRAQHAAEVALRRNTKATFTAFSRRHSTLPRIENANATARAEPLCVLCIDEPAVVMAYPCGHRCFCECCADDRRTDLQDCPICRDPVEHLVRVY